MCKLYSGSEWNLTTEKLRTACLKTRLTVITNLSFIFGYFPITRALRAVLCLAHGLFVCGTEHTSSGKEGFY